jgi:alanyl-tRNA synthetase
MEGATTRLYLEEPYRTEFEAEIIESLTHEQSPAVILDQTLFYPESGGQPADRGWIDGAEVVHVLGQDDKILHVLDEPIASEHVRGKIDWARRFDHMQQHTGQHILSQSFHELFEAETVAFHLGEVASLLEIDLRKIDEPEVEKVEKRANTIVQENREIKSYFVHEDKVHTIPLRRPPKKRGQLRIVEVSDYDYSACGGTHLRRSGEVGLIKISRWERIRNNIRFEFLCGTRALEDYIRKSGALRQLSLLLTAHEQDTPGAVEKLMAELKTERKKKRQLQQKNLEYEAQDIIQKAEGRIIKAVFTGRGRNEVRMLALNIIRAAPSVVVHGLRDEKGVHVVLARSEAIDLDLRELVPELSAILEGKGGGRESLVEVAGQDEGQLEQAVNKAIELIKTRM